MKPRVREVAVVAGSGKRKRWGDVKARLETFDRRGLLRLIADLYDASSANRRFLESRLLPESGGLEEYGRIVADAIYPDPFSHRSVSVRDAGAAIANYKRTTGDLAGTVDLMLTFVEAGAEQAADLGYGADAYFNAMESRLRAIVKAFDDLPETVRVSTIARLARVRSRAKQIGWGCRSWPTSRRKGRTRRCWRRTTSRAPIAPNCLTRRVVFIKSRSGYTNGCREIW